MRTAPQIHQENSARCATDPRTVTAEQIQQELTRIHPRLLPTVLDFILFLQQRTPSLHDDMMLAQESSARSLWDNDEDEVWNEVPTR